MEWPDFNDQANIDDLCLFFDHYLKGGDNGWEKTPRVRYSLLDLNGNDRLNIPESQFPPSDVTYVKYFLDATSHSLGTKHLADSVSTSYDAQSQQDHVSFTIRFDTEIEIVGYPMVRLWVEAEGSDDMDVFVLLQKLNTKGEPLEQFNVPNHGEVMESLTRNGSSILKYKGSNGRLRVSMRHLDEAMTTDEVPVHSFDRVEKLEPGAIVPVEIDMFPVGLAFRPKESLRLVVSGYNVLGGVMPNRSTVIPDNHGRHIIHTGGSYASYLRLPVKQVEPKTKGWFLDGSVDQWKVK
jgi:predicted acyl esterase